MKRSILSLAAVALLHAAATAHCLAQDVWTNTAGRAFSATLTALDDQRATFVMQNGTTNVLALAALSPSSQKQARRVSLLPEIPDALRATFDLCMHDLRRINALRTDGRLDADAHADARRRLLNGFRVMHAKHGLPAEGYPALEQRLLRSTDTPEDRPR